jgi:hypothetical protein
MIKERNNFSRAFDKVESLRASGKFDEALDYYIKASKIEPDHKLCVLYRFRNKYNR